MFYINVIGQQMYVSSAPERVVEGSQEFVKFRFHLSEEWNGLTVFAQFRQGSNAYNKYLDSEDTVTLPPEIKEGTCTLMLYGSHGTVIGTSNYITLRVDKNHFVSDAGSTQLSTSLYNQLVTAVADMENRLRQVEEHGISSERLSEMIGEEVSKYLGSGQPAEGAVLYNKSQNLTAAQRKTARENLGIYTDSAEPSNPKEGDLWINPENGGSAPADYGVNDSAAAGYIQNRPVWITESTESFTWDGQATGVSVSVEQIANGATLYRVSDLVPSGEALATGTAEVMINGERQTWPVIGFFSNMTDYDTAMTTAEEYHIAILDGRCVGLPAGCLVLYAVGIDFGYVLPSFPDTAAGIYLRQSSDEIPVYLAGMTYTNVQIHMDKRYASALKQKGETRVFLLDVQTEDVSGLDFSGYKAGDVILVTMAGGLSGVMG